MKRARDDIADAVMEMERRHRNHLILHVREEEEEEGGGERSAAPACFDDVALLSLSCGGSSSCSQEAAGTCTPPSGDKRGRDDDAFQCRTCGRQFATFQALGGHRTSHLRQATEHHHRPKPVLVHACAMCGMGFSTGQALGGHMRRHRGPSSTKEDSGYMGLTQVIVHERPSSASLQLLNLFV